MSTDRDTTRIVRSWLRSDEHESADRVLDAVIDQLDTTSQRRSTWWPARKVNDMNSYARFSLVAVGAAAVVAAVVLGGGLFAGSPTGGPVAGIPTPTLAASSSAMPDEEGLIRAWIDAVNARDFDTAAGMMSRRVETGTTPVEGPEAIRTALEQLHPCVLTVESIEDSGASFLVNVRFESSASRDCPADVAETEGTFVLGVADGEITRIP
jgi:hypothetical protein